MFICYVVVVSWTSCERRITAIHPQLQILFPTKVFRNVQTVVLNKIVYKHCLSIYRVYICVMSQLETFLLLHVFRNVLKPAENKQNCARKTLSRDFLKRMWVFYLYNCCWVINNISFETTRITVLVQNFRIYGNGI